MSRSNKVQNSQIDCEVAVPDPLVMGVYANAFRVVGEVGHDCLLDFAVYSADKQRAEVVSRVRVHRSFLADLHRRLGTVLSPDASVLPGDSDSDYPDQETAEGILIMPGSSKKN